MDNNIKSYYVQLPSGDGQVWDSDKFNRNKEQLMSDHPDVIINELSDYDPNDMDLLDSDQYSITLPGSGENQTWDAAKFTRNRERLLADHPDVRIQRVRRYSPEAEPEAAAQEAPIDRATAARYSDLAGRIAAGASDLQPVQTMSTEDYAKGIADPKAFQKRYKQQMTQDTMLDSGLDEVSQYEVIERDENGEFSENSPRTIVDAEEYFANPELYAPNDNRQVKRNAMVVGEDGIYNTSIDVNDLRNAREQKAQQEEYESAIDDLNSFNEENDAFLQEYEAKLNSLAGVRNYNAAVSADIDYINDNRDKYEAIKAQRQALEDAVTNSPMYQAVSKNIRSGAQEIQDKTDETLNSLRGYESMSENAPGNFDETLADALEQMTGHRPEPGNAVADLYHTESVMTAAKHFADQALKTMNAPDKEDSGWKAFGSGAVDTLTDPAFWSRGLSSMIDNKNVRDAFKKIQEKFGSIKQDDFLDDGKMNTLFTPEERDMLKAYVLSALAQSQRAVDTNKYYDSGRTAVESLGFMAEFLLSNAALKGIGGALKATEKGTALAEWLGKISGLSVETAATGAEKALLAGKTIGAPVAKTVAMMPFMPGTYKMYSEKSLELDKDKKLISPWKAAALTLRDQGLEVWSEQALSPILEYMGGLVGWAAKDAGLSAAPWLRMAGDKITDWTRAAQSSQVMQLLKQGGWDGFLEEMGEEVLNAGVAQMWDKESWDNFWTADNLASMAVAFAPMAAFGFGATAANMRRKQMDYEESRPAIIAMLTANGYTQEEAENMTDIKGQTFGEVGEKLKTAISAATSQGQLNDEQRRALLKFASASGQKTVADAFFEDQNQKERNAQDADNIRQMGEYSMVDESIAAQLEDREALQRARVEAERQIKNALAPEMTVTIDGNEGTVKSVKADGVVVDFGESVTIDGVKRRVQKISFEKAGAGLAEPINMPQSLAAQDTSARNVHVVTMDDGTRRFIRDDIKQGDTYLYVDETGKRGFMNDEQLAAVPQENNRTIALNTFLDEQIDASKKERENQRMMAERAQMEGDAKKALYLGRDDLMIDIDGDGNKARATIVDIQGNVYYVMPLDEKGNPMKTSTGEKRFEAIPIEKAAKAIGMDIDVQTDLEKEKEKALNARRTTIASSFFNRRGAVEFTHNGKKYIYLNSKPVIGEDSSSLEVIARDAKDRIVKLNDVSIDEIDNGQPIQGGLGSLLEKKAEMEKLRSQELDQIIARHTDASGNVDEDALMAENLDAFIKYSDGAHSVEDTDATLDQLVADLTAATIQAKADMDSKTGNAKKAPRRDYMNLKGRLDMVIDTNARRKSQRASEAVDQKTAGISVDDYLKRGLSLDEVYQLAVNSMAESQERMDATPKPVVSTNVEEYIKAKEQYANDIAAEQKMWDMWNNVATEAQTRMADEARRSHTESLKKRDENLRSQKNIQKLQELIDAENAGSGRNLVTQIVTMNDYREVMTADGCAEKDIAEVDRAISDIITGREMLMDGQINGCQVNGKIYIFAEFNPTASTVEVALRHESQHVFNEEEMARVKAGVLDRKDTLIGKIEQAAKSAKDLETVVVNLSGVKGSNPYVGRSLKYLADEFSAYALETGAKVDEVRLRNAGASEELINIIKEEYGRQSESDYWAAARQYALNYDAQPGGNSGNELNQRVESGSLGEQGPGSLAPGNGEAAEESQVNFSLKNLYDAEKFIETNLKSGKSNVSFEFDLPNATKRMIRSAMGRDFASHNIDINGVRHGLKNHGVNGKKLKENSIPIREEDAKLIPYIMTAPSYITRGSDDLTRESIRFYKTLSNGYVVVVEKEQKNSPEDMDTINIWAELSDVANAQLKTNPGATSETVTISTSDAAKIRKDAESAILNELNDSNFRVTEPAPGTDGGIISEQTAQELADHNLVMAGGAVMDTEHKALKDETGYLTPNEREANVDDVHFSITTMDAWRRNYRQLPDSEERIVKALTNWAERAAADELVSGVISQGEYEYMGKKKVDSGTFAGPIRTNVEYIVTFDMDTTCPRTFQYLNYSREIERRIGRPLTQTECIQLIEMMRAYGQQIPCVYCYAENKRQALKQYYTNFIQARHAVLQEEDEAKALEAMYGHDGEWDSTGSLDPDVVLTKPAAKVFKEWRKNRRSMYNPTMKMLWMHYNSTRDSILTDLDMMLADGRIGTKMKDSAIVNLVATDLHITDKEAMKVVADIVSEWKWDAIEGKEHQGFTAMDEDDIYANENALKLWREMTAYAKSASSAKSVLRYVPYTDELKYISEEDRNFINGMGGLRMHSSNDFRIDYVLDYFQFMADMAANKMYGHTYTKSPEFVRIFGNSGYKINMSIAAYQDANGNIRMNEDEGFNWDVARELRAQFPNAGIMLMATSDEQIQMALDSDWIDMFIPFHASSLPEVIWKNMRSWSDYTARQNERFFNSDDIKAALTEAGIPFDKKMAAKDLEQLYFDKMGIKRIYKKSGKDAGKRVRPHFLPGPTIVEGELVPGHNNDIATYFELCRQYGVHPRFEGIQVKDAQGNTIDITQHPGYIKCIKETARTDSPQTAIQFNFDQPSEALGGKSPLEYALDALRDMAAAEQEMAGKAVQDIYESTKQDPYGIIPQFINVIAKHKDETGEDYPIDFLTPDAREWFLTERKALQEAYSDVAEVPYHPVAYDEQGQPIADEAQANLRIAPNGQPSNLTDEQYDMVRTPEFKAWFGDWENDPENASKLVDENGEPKVFYHGTGREFNIFRNSDTASELGAGYYFTDSRKLAEWYSNPENVDNANKIEAEAFDRFAQKGFEKTGEEYDESDLYSGDSDIVRDYNEAYDEATAALFGSPRVIPVFLNVRNPRLVLEDGNLEAPRGGHDGVVDASFAERHKELLKQAKVDYAMQVMTYDNTQIKSAEPVTYDDAGNVIPLSQRFNPESNDIRFRTAEQKQELFNKAKEIMGITSNIKAAGYILPDGALLDFSGSKFGSDDTSRRHVDHREIDNYLYDAAQENPNLKTDMNDFMAEGAIRILPESGTINLTVAPTKEQRSKIRDFIYRFNGAVDIEMSDEQGTSKAYAMYRERTSPTRVLGDIDAYFKDGTLPVGNEPMFRVANQNQEIFVSNAEQAVNALNMPKATPEQWLKAIQGRGGLKAGEDKWLGLSEWLQSSDKKSITKEEVLDFIRENKIQIEEQRYSENVDVEEYVKQQAIDTILGGKGLEEVQAEIDEEAESGARFDFVPEGAPQEDLDQYLTDVMVQNYGDDFSTAFSIIDGQIEFNMNPWDYESDEVAAGVDGERPINDTRLDYTTRGLKNKREIALTVPTIEPWGQDDNVHFGDAGNGRAVAWIRFGETELYAGSEKELKDAAGMDLGEYLRSVGIDGMMSSSERKAAMASLSDEQRSKVRELKEKASSKFGGAKPTARVLIIDEIQSKRHQEGREKGYKDMDAHISALDAFQSFNKEMHEKYGQNTIPADWGEADRIRFNELRDAEDATAKNIGKGIPTAPFEKNWHELAMKRMLRLAAEEGYDYVAWTTGAQQAERYDIGEAVNTIKVHAPYENGSRDVTVEANINDYLFTVNGQGEIEGESESPMNFEGQKLSDVLGKELAAKILSGEYDGRSIEGNDLRMGGEGMKGFYDDILPRFVNKYGKTWGVKTQDIELPNVEEAGRIMHAVPVTEEMKQSVMEGQPMFRVTEITPEVRAEMDSIKADAQADGTFMKAPNGAATKLSEENWLLTRTGNFKNWFGDWVGREFLLSDRYVSRLTGNEFEKDETPITEKVAKFYKENYDNQVARDGVGTVVLDARSVKDSIAHGLGRNKAAAFAAVPDVIKSGIEIDRQSNWKGRGYDSVTIAAPISINGEGCVAVVVLTQSLNSNRFYLHEVALQKNLQDEGFKTGTKADLHQGDIANVLRNFLNTSKVVDKNGEPMVQYHGSRNYGFTVFDTHNELGGGEQDNIGSHFGPKDTAGTFVEDRNGRYDLSKMYSVFLNIRNPYKTWDFFADVSNNAYLQVIQELLIDAKNVETERIANRIYDVYPQLRGMDLREIDILEEFDDDEGLEEREIATSEKTGETYYTRPDLNKNRDAMVSIIRDMMASEGYDGMVYENWYEGESNNVCWVALEPNQIKSATDNNGEFSNDNPDIRFRTSESPLQEMNDLRSELQAKYNGAGQEDWSAEDQERWADAVSNWINQPMENEGRFSVGYPSQVTDSQKEIIAANLKTFTDPERLERAKDAYTNAELSVRAAYEAEYGDQLARKTELEAQMKELNISKGKARQLGQDDVFKQFNAEFQEVKSELNRLNLSFPGFKEYCNQNQRLKAERDNAIMASGVLDNKQWKEVAVIPTFIPEVAQALKDLGWNGNSNMLWATEYGFVSHRAAHHSDLTDEEVIYDMQQNLYSGVAGISRGARGELSVKFIRKDANGLWYTTAVSVNRHKNDGSLEFITTYKDKNDPTSELERVIYEPQKGAVASNQIPEGFKVNDAKVSINSGSAIGSEKNRTNFRFIGEKGARRLDTIVERTPAGEVKITVNGELTNNLQLANKMEKEGKDAKAIKVATGWERGADGKWRYEQHDIRFTRPSDTLWHMDEGKTLDSFVADKDLFKAYPELKDVKVFVTKLSSDTAGSVRDGDIYLNSQYMQKAGDVYTFLDLGTYDTLLHEIQHKIQAIEGFARGDNNRLTADDLRSFAGSEAAFAFAEAFGANTERALKAQNPSRLALLLRNNYDSFTGQKKEWADILIETLEDISKSDYIQLVHDSKSAIKRGRTKAGRDYRNSAGEAEARNVERRRAMTPEERRNSLASETVDVPYEDQIVRFSVRTKPAPEKTGIGYKVFYQKDGKLYPPMVANPNGEATPVGVWLDADAAPIAGTSKTGRPQVKAGGKGTQGGSGQLAYRPGWHLGTIPYAIQFNRKDENGEKTLFPKDFVWAEVEYAADNNYQQEAEAEGVNPSGKFQHSLAGLKRLPEDGYYMYRTNPNPETDPWIITGAMKVNKVLTRAEVDALVREAGREPQRVEGDQQPAVSFNNRPAVEIPAGDTGKVMMRVFQQTPDATRQAIVDDAMNSDLNFAKATARHYGDLAMKDELTEDEKNEVRAAADVMARELGLDGMSNNEAIMAMWDAGNRDGSILAEMRRSMVQRNLGLTPAEQEAVRDVDTEIRFRNAMNVFTGSAANFYNRNVNWFWNMMDEAYVDMNMSVNKLIEGIEKMTGEKAEGWEDIRLALNQLSSKNLADKQTYMAKYFEPLMQAIYDVINQTGKSYERVERYMMLKHGLERNDVFAKRDAIDYYKKQRDEHIATIKVNVAKALQVKIDEIKADYPTDEWDIEIQAAKDAAKMDQEQKIKEANNFFENRKNDIENSKYDRNADAELARAEEDYKAEKEDIAARKKSGAISAEEASDLYDQNLKNFKKRQRDIEKRYGVNIHYLENRRQDYSGLMAWYVDEATIPERLDTESEEEYRTRAAEASKQVYDNLADAEEHATSEVESFEHEAHVYPDEVDSFNRRSHGTKLNGEADLATMLWEKVNAATNESLRIAYDKGLISKAEYDHVRGMFQYYVPLMGFQDDTAADVYHYTDKGVKTSFTQVIQHAKGRRTIADSPLGWIGNKAESVIQEGNKNEAKKTLYYFLQNRPNQDIITIDKQWYERGSDKDGNEVWNPIYPKLDKSMTGEQVVKALDEFKQYLDTHAKDVIRKDSKLALDKGLVFVQPKAASEHEIRIKINGDETVMYVNGNPRAAQAINGMLNSDRTRSASFIKGSVLRWQASVSTSYNPEFWISNFQRDFIFSRVKMDTQGDPLMKEAYNRNYGEVFRSTLKLMKAYNNGTLGNSRMETYYKEYADNGGITGYTVLADHDEFEEMMKDFVESQKDGKTKAAAKRVAESVQDFAESIEQINRFAGFVAARESGKDIETSVSWAKEITANFNRKGSAVEFTMDDIANMTTRNGRKLNKTEQRLAYMALNTAGLGRSSYLFFNAAIQGLKNHVDIIKANPAGAAKWAAILIVTGALNAIIHAALDDPDDDNNYAGISDYTRRTNLLLGGKGYYIKWAIPQEERAFYAIGDILANKLLGKSPDEKVGLEIAKQFTDLLPLGTAAGGDFLGTILPAQLAPFYEAAVNKNFTGSKLTLDYPGMEDKAAYKSATRNTRPVFVKISKAVNNIGKEGDYEEIGRVEQSDLGRAINNPAFVQHIIEGYTGGIGKTITKFLDTFTGVRNMIKDLKAGDSIDKAWQEMPKASDAPFIGRVFVNTNRNASSYVSNVYNYYSDIAAVAKNSQANAKEALEEAKAAKMAADKAESEMRRQGDEAHDPEIVRAKEKADAAYEKAMADMKQFNASEKKRILDAVNAFKKGDAYKSLDKKIKNEPDGPERERLLKEMSQLKLQLVLELSKPKEEPEENEENN